VVRVLLGVLLMGTDASTPTTARSTRRATMVAALVLTACGARTGLLVDDKMAIARDAGTQCNLSVAGKPLVLVALPDAQCHTPSLAVLEKGSAGVPASVAVLTVATLNGRSEVRATSVRIGPAWQEPVVRDRPVVVVGKSVRGPTEGVGWGHFARSADGQTLGFAFPTDEDGPLRPVFRGLDIGRWSLGPSTALTAQAESTVFGLVSGSGVGAAGYSGAGYGVVWRQYVHESDGAIEMTTLAAVLDDRGTVVLGPHPVLPPRYDARFTSLGWTGSSYLVATGMGECPTVDPLCTPHAVVVSRLRPASGMTASGVEHVVSIPALRPDASPSPPSLATWGNSAWVAWFEDAPEDPRRTLRVVRLSADGAVVSPPRTLATDVAPIRFDEGGTSRTAWVGLQASELGVVCTWSEDGDTTLAPNQVGRSRVRALLLDEDAAPRGPALTIETTMLNTLGWKRSVALSSPRSLVLAWAGRSTTSSDIVVWGARLDCL